jgi:hypothetical protein
MLETWTSYHVLQKDIHRRGTESAEKRMENIRKEERFPKKSVPS